MTLGAGPEEARATAELERIRRAARDAQFAAWAGATTGAPVLVRSIDGAPSYWTVPVEGRGRVIGFVRVAFEGRVAAAGLLRNRPQVVTGITQEEATRAVAAATGLTQNDLEPPIYVHDGPPGRETWLVTEHRGEPRRRWFVSAAGVVDQHPAGSG